MHDTCTAEHPSRIAQITGQHIQVLRNRQDRGVRTQPRTSNKRLIYISKGPMMCRIHHSHGMVCRPYPHLDGDLWLLHLCQILKRKGQEPNGSTSKPV